MVRRFLEPSPTSEASSGVSSEVSLRQWLNHVFDRDWSPPSDLLNRMAQTVFYRSSLSHREDPFRRRLEILYRQHSGDPPPPLPNHQSDQETLVNLIQTAQNDNIRWQAAELLWELNPRHPACPIMTAKDVGLYLMGHRIALAIGVLTKSDDSLLILTRVYPLGEHAHLPPGLTLTGLDEAGAPFFEVTSRQQDNYIQFKFVADDGDRFSIHITLEQATFVESFVV